MQRYSLNKPHPHADKIQIDTSEKDRFETSDADSWVTGNRPKTGAYGEHLLWPEVSEAVKPFLDGRDVLPITGAGTKWYKTHASNPQAKFGKWFTDLVKKVQKTHPDFPALPFGSLRDLLPDLIRIDFNDSVAALCLHHGTIGDDKLLDRYANRPYKKLFNATRELREHFKPFLDELKTDQSD